MDIHDIIIRILSGGPHEGKALHQEFVSVCGNSAPYALYRNALVDLIKAKKVERHATHDEDGELLEVIFKLSNNKPATGGIQNENTQFAA